VVSNDKYERIIIDVVFLQYIEKRLAYEQRSSGLLFIILPVVDYRGAVLEISVYSERNVRAIEVIELEHVVVDGNASVG